MQPFAAALLACLALLALMVPSEAGVTNSERFRRGLPPLPPVKRATRTFAAKRQANSPLSSPSYSGALQLRYADGPQVGSTAGYVANAVTTGPTGLTVNTANELSVLYQGGSIQATNALFPAPYYIGGSGTTPLATGSSASIPFINVNAGPSAKIWTLDPTTGALTASWTNPDGSQIALALIYTPSSNVLSFTGDRASFIAGSPSSVAVAKSLSDLVIENVPNAH
ncbi:hypothetical protein FA95DRAFT_1606332 [Auriscalpium vulgare]|uniref:Uncharacterized protein n=1 Tax=Auriscalpium vulgare TaxID=40419 RepID=A0ACB8RTJ5_9AGAM|nr:hypothetical protein FA95DRAFT_1606332 [Auriscalpium vulgare]